MRRGLVVIVLVLTVVLGGVAATPAGAAPVQDTPSTQTTVTAVPTPRAIPRPNQGVPPEDPGDRGGALQAAMFFIILGGTLVIGGLAYRQSRRARAERGF